MRSAAAKVLEASAMVVASGAAPAARASAGHLVEAGGFRRGLRQLPAGRVGLRPFLRLAGAQGCIHLVLQRVQQRAGGLPPAWVHLAQIAHLQADLALLAQGGQPHLFQRRLIRRSGDGGQISGLERVKPLHEQPPLPALRC